MANAPGSFIWYELMTPDASKAATFYNEVIGWKIALQPDVNSQGRDYRMIVRSDGGNAGGVLQLTREMQSQGARPAWLSYLYVPDVDAATKAIEADGGKKYMRMSLPVGEIAMVADPTGVPFYLMKPVPPPGQPDARSDVFDVDAAQRVRWNELASPDLEKAKSFYARHFGFAFNEKMSMGEMGDYCFFDLDGVRTGALMQQPKGSPVAGWLPYIGVMSVMEAHRRIKQAGGTILMEPHAVPGGNWIIVANDPQGAPFGVVGPQGQ